MRTILAILLAVPLVAAGCVNAPEDVEAASTSADALDASSRVETPYTYDGTIGPALVVCPMITCEGVDMSERWVELDHAGNITALNLTMTWSASTPNMETLRFGVSWGENFEGFEYVEGGSPLALAKDVNIGANEDAWLWAWVVTPVPMGFAHAGTPTDYHVEGTIAEAGP